MTYEQIMQTIGLAVKEMYPNAHPEDSLNFQVGLYQSVIKNLIYENDILKLQLKESNEKSAN